MSEEQKKEPTFEQSLARLAARCTNVAGGSPHRSAATRRYKVDVVFGAEKIVHHTPCQRAQLCLERIDDLHSTINLSVVEILGDELAATVRFGRRQQKGVVELHLIAFGDVKPPFCHMVWKRHHGNSAEELQILLYRIF